MEGEFQDQGQLDQDLEDLSAAISGTIICPRTRVTTPEVLLTRETTPHDTDYVISLQYMQRQRHGSTNISNRTAPGNRTLGPFGSCSMFVMTLI